MGPPIWRGVVVAGFCLVVIFVRYGAAQQQETFNTQPPPLRSRFSCSGRGAGYYADLESNCRAYHTCDEHGNHFTHFCPEDTAFRQDAMICDHAYQVDCAAGTTARIYIGGQTGSFINEPRGESSNGFVNSFKPEEVTSTASERRELAVGSETGFQRTTFSGRDDGQTLRSTAATGPQQRVDNNLSSRSGSTAPASEPRITPPPRTFPSFNGQPSTPTISLDLLPPAESPNLLELQEPDTEILDDEYSFLNPPPIRTDNDYRNPIQSFPDPPAPITQPEPPRSRSLEPSTIPSKPSKLLEPPYLDYNPPSEPLRPSNRADDYAYAETLRSIQSSSSTESPVARIIFSTTTPTTTTTTTTPRAEIFGVPHAVLLPPENPDSDVDPYYPKDESSTEAYFTPSGRPQFGPTTPTRRRPQHHQQGTGTASKFHVPPVLPDLNSLDDLLDRRKQFFIPTLKAGT
ncbi:hypothetical protein QAD02_008743 [Eretmocerus hayati]|uniref:Uncharacterized protein n=1 Tax=Eretmocerus hayati TaxID=131215 RepID=A0ACC2N858_9HYME|nr:hypothetical protein QAD02_008743 [Eretmocerus hayati]